jgi:hypothetical protein
MGLWAGRDRGAIAANTAILLATVPLFFLVVQASLWFYGRTVMGSAAQHGLDAARVQDGSAAAGEAIVDEFLAQVGGLDGHTRTVVRTATTVTVTIQAEPIPVLPFVEPPLVTVQLEGPVERVVE